MEETSGSWSEHQGGLSCNSTLWIRCCTSCPTATGRLVSSNKLPEDIEESRGHIFCLKNRCTVVTIESEKDWQRWWNNISQPILRFLCPFYFLWFEKSHFYEFVCFPPFINFCYLYPWKLTDPLKIHGSKMIHFLLRWSLFWGGHIGDMLIFINFREVFGYITKPKQTSSGWKVFHPLSPWKRIFESMARWSLWIPSDSTSVSMVPWIRK